MKGREFMKKILALCLVLILSVSLFGCENEKDAETYEATLYFVNAAKTDLVPETRKIKYTVEEKLEQKVVEELLKGPLDKTNLPVIPKDTELLSVKIKDNYVEVNFTAGIYSGIETDNILIRTSLLKTLTSIPGVEGVKILVNSGAYIDNNGMEVGTIFANDIVYDTELEDEQHRYVRLYFADKDAGKLVAEARKVELSPKESIEMRILKELIKGPEKNFLSKTIPEETRILSVETKEGVCFVNLSQEFITKHIGGSSSEMITVYSIVNSLTQLENVDKVQFLIEGQKTEVYIQMIFNEPFTQNDSIIG